MPGNGFSFAVFIRREQHLRRLLRRFFQVCNQLFLFRRNDVLRCVIVLDINTELFRLQVADVSVTRHDPIVFTQKFLDGFCFRRRLYDNQFFLHLFSLFFFKIRGRDYGTEREKLFVFLSQSRAYLCFSGCKDTKKLHSRLYLLFLRRLLIKHQ